MADSEVEEFMSRFLNAPLTKFMDRTTGNIHTQNPDENLQGYPLKGEPHPLFKSYKPIVDAYKEWIKKPGVKDAIKNTHDDKDYEKEVRQVIKWVETGCHKPIKVNMLLDAPDYDFLMVSGFPVVVSERALSYLETHRKGQFEAFPIVDVNKKVKQKYYAINVITPDFDFNFDVKFKGLKDA
tara:strand:+ start:277 stop:822 length:546 start_codon:yes stop_codon:yes gene_type:complete